MPSVSTTYFDPDFNLRESELLEDLEEVVVPRLLAQPPHDVLLIDPLQELLERNILLIDRKIKLVLAHPEVLAAPLPRDDLYAGHDVLHDGVVDLLGDEPLLVLRLVDVQQVHQELDCSTLDEENLVCYNC